MRAPPPILASFAIALFSPAVAAAQGITISGVVTDALQSAPVAGATVTLTGLPSVLTDANGSFRLADATPGSHVLTVAAIGYRYVTIELAATADTVVRVALERLPQLLDPTIARAGNVRIAGSVRDAETLASVIAGSATLYPGGRSVGLLSGDFVFENAPQGDSVTLVIEALEYLPKRVTFVPGADTSLTIGLAVDSVGRRLIAQQVQRLVSRSRSAPRSLDDLNRDEIEKRNEPTVGDLIRHRLPAGTVTDRWPHKSGCIFFDDQPVGFDLLLTLPLEHIERIEIYGSRGSMIRVYSKRFVASLTREKTIPVFSLFC